MEPARAIRVLIVDDHVLVRAGIAALLRALDGIEVVGEAGDGTSGVALAARLQPDVVVLDIEMEGVDGLEAARRMSAQSPDVRLVMLSMHRDADFVEQALAAGASAYLLKGASTAELEIAVRSVARGESYLSPAVSGPVIESFVRRGAERGPVSTLTQRQRDVLKLLAEGKANKEIAHDLGLSVKTVEYHRAQIQERLGVRDLAGLIRFALRNGLASTED
jgi:DNA-binding NarL/FixJ family response regulator